MVRQVITTTHERLSNQASVLQLTYPIERWPSITRFKDEDELEKLLNTIATSDSVNAACKKLNVDRGYIYRRLSVDKEFNAKFHAAREGALHLLEAQALELIDACKNDIISVSKARAQADIRLRLIGIHRKALSLTQVNITQNDNRTLVVNDEQRQKLIELRNNALALNDKQQEK